MKNPTQPLNYPTCSLVSSDRHYTETLQEMLFFLPVKPQLEILFIVLDTAGPGGHGGRGGMCVQKSGD